MTDTKGGFLSVEDDPHNKAMFVPEKDNGKPAHMTLKEWEMHNTLKELRRKREGIFEPGLSMDPENRKKCNECRSIEIDWQWDEIFKIQVCNSCKDKFPDKYSLLTKTEAQKDYLLTNRMSYF
jgi:DNA-repair protein complementing XP-A cells